MYEKEKRENTQEIYTVNLQYDIFNCHHSNHLFSSEKMLPSFGEGLSCSMS